MFNSCNKLIANRSVFVYIKAASYSYKLKLNQGVKCETVKKKRWASNS